MINCQMCWLSMKVVTCCSVRFDAKSCKEKQAMSEKVDTTAASARNKKSKTETRLNQSKHNIDDNMTRIKTKTNAPTLIGS